MPKFTEKTIKTAGLKSLLYTMRQYAIEANEEPRNDSFFWKEIDRIEQEIERRISTGQKTVFEVRISFLRGEHLKDYQERGYASSFERYTERFITKAEAEKDLKESRDYCEARGWPILSATIEEMGC